MKGHQTLPDVVRPRNYRKAASHFKSTSWANAALQPNLDTDGALILAGACVCQILVWWKRKGGGIRGSPEITLELQHKSNTVALTDPSKKTVLPVQLDPAFSTSCWLPRTASPVLTSAAAQRSQQPSTNKAIYGGPCIDRGPEGT